MKKQENMKITGHLQIWLVHKDGSKELKFDDKNVKTMRGMLNIAKLIGGKITRSVNTIAIGDGGVEGDSTIFTPLVASETDVTLRNELTRAYLSVNNDISVPTESDVENYGITPYVKFDYLFLSSSSWPWRKDNPPTDLNEYVINEAGLFMDNQSDINILVCRKTFASIPFDPVDGLGIKVVWTLEVV